MSGTFSFLEVSGGISGPGCDIDLGAESGSAEEGITIERAGDTNSMIVGAGGAVQHNLHADRSGKVTVRLLKTSPTNALLMDAFNFQTASGSTHGRNVMVFQQIALGDVTTATQVAFTKRPTNSYSKAGAMVEWTFDCGRIDGVLGDGA